MRTTTTTCDRCSEVVKEDETVELSLITTILTEDEDGGYAEVWDLCPACRDVIREGVVELLTIEDPGVS